MGINGQKRKKKQGPVPTLEESLPKKFKSDEPSKPKAKENGVKDSKKEQVREEEKVQKQKPAPVVEFDSDEEVEEQDGEEMTSRDFSATKASLFDDADDLPEDEFNGIEDGSDEEMDDNSEGDEDSVFDSDEEEERNGKPFSDSDEDDEELTAANMEALSAKLDTFAREDILAAQDELLNPVEPVAEGVLLNTEANEDLSSVRTRIMEIVRVLSNFKNLQEDGVKRKDYVERLVSDIAGYYSYNTYLARKFLEMFSIAEAIEFFEANEVPRPVFIRTNTLKTTRRELVNALSSRGVNLRSAGKWTDVGLQIFESPVPIGATPEYLAGHYILQSASSFLPVLSLAPQPKERVLDMAAAPGGKTTYISQMMQNMGVIFANDKSRDRGRSLLANIHRLGCRNIIVGAEDGRDFPKVMGGFDRVLLDAPCSGTGVISKDPGAKSSKLEADFRRLSDLQKDLLLHAIDAVDANSPTGGVIVYATCSVTIDENEAVVAYALRKRRNVRIESTGLQFGDEGYQRYRGKNFGPDMKLCRRYWPHKHNLDGFFVCRLRKFSNVIPQPKESESESDDEEMDVENDGEETEGDTADGENETRSLWDEDEDKKYIEESQMKQIRKRGLKPLPRSEKKKE